MVNKLIDYEELEKFDKNKTKVLKYVLYKKRSVNEIKRKFENEIDADMLDKIITNLQENGYVDDSQYIERSVNEFMALKNISLKQIKYKLLTKGIDVSLIEDYFYKNRESMNEYEINSAYNLIIKKSDCSEEEIIGTLLKKGFNYDNVKEALERSNEWKLY